MAKKENLEISSLKSHLGYRMRVVSNAVSHSFARKLAACEVTVAEWVVLREMYSSNETTSQSAIAELTGLTRGAISKLVDRLLKKDLVTRKEASGDRRFQDIKLTATALKLIPKLAAIADENDEQFFSSLSNTDRMTLLGILTKLAKTHNLNTSPTE